jgi:HPt (histidine-containing phosphotransfer) domain-containing protein
MSETPLNPQTPAKEEASSPPDPAVAARMKTMLAQIWRNSEATLMERIAAIRRAEEGLRLGALAEDQREEARAAAHKLAGVLGTFGLPRGTELARRVEAMLQSDDAAGLDDADQLASVIEELSALVQAKSSELA